MLIGAGVGLALAPSTESVLGSLPKEEAGVGSASSDTSMQIGGALGVAVLGTALAIRYTNVMTPLLAHRDIPAGVDQLILGSLGGALAVARAPGTLGEEWPTPPGVGSFRAWTSASSSLRWWWAWLAWSSWPSCPTALTPQKTLRHPRDVAFPFGRVAGTVDQGVGTHLRDTERGVTSRPAEIPQRLR